MARRCRSYTGFTLVELLIAVAITVLIVVLLGTMFGSLSSTASRANQRIDAFRDARAALQMMERDLSGIVKGQWDTTNNPPTPITRPAAYFALDKIYADDPAPGNQQIFALVATKNSGPGDVCAVGYYCRWDDQTHSYSLRRFFRPSNDTFTALSSATTYARTTDLYKPDPAGTTRSAMKDDLLAAHVWNLQVKAYDSDNTEIPTTPSYVCDASAAGPPQPLPAVIEISFNAMSAEAARTVMAANRGAADWMNPNEPLIRPHAYEFRTRIKL